ncbi:hypothetical protein TDB9533_01452 [Thalassocella blandensis]|nr:hypothetical protein TDB9533_01452 [Thalassocella blandensis]
MNKISDPQNNPILDLQQRLIAFAQERDWEQFQAPKNLSMALSVETAELMEHFQWLSEEQSRNLNSETLTKVQDELADVFLYSLLLAKRLDIDIYSAALSKMDKNAAKYPADKVRGSAKKFSDY